MGQEQWYALGEILLAMILGGAIGFEREVADKPAGLRTHMLVGGSAALLVVLGSFLLETYNARFTSELIRADPNRIIEAIIVGISFIGAGTIFRSEKGDQVEGLTTAASILFTAGIGIAVALRQLGIALGGTVLLLAVMRILGYVEHRFISPTTKRE